MKAYSVAFTSEAQKQRAKIPLALRQRIDKKLQAVASDPHGVHANATKLQGREGYRLRVGDWRVLYLLDKGALVVLVLEILPRGSAYKH